MFKDESAFNSNIGNWDVSNGQSFVRIVMNIVIVIMYESTHVTHNLFLHCYVIFMRRIYVWWSIGIQSKSLQVG